MNVTVMSLTKRG